MTKKYLMTLAAAVCCAMTMAVLSACTEKEDNLAGPDSPADQAEYASCYMVMEVAISTVVSWAT